MILGQIGAVGHPGPHPDHLLTLVPLAPESQFGTLLMIS